MGGSPSGNRGFFSFLYESLSFYSYHERELVESVGQVKQLVFPFAPTTVFLPSGKLGSTEKFPELLTSSVFFNLQG